MNLETEEWGWRKASRFCGAQLINLQQWETKKSGLKDLSAKSFHPLSLSPRWRRMRFCVGQRKSCPAWFPYFFLHQTVLLLWETQEMSFQGFFFAVYSSIAYFLAAVVTQFLNFFLFRLTRLLSYCTKCTFLLTICVCHVSELRKFEKFTLYWLHSPQFQKICHQDTVLIKKK